MRILVATDAWRPQVNGVVRTLESTAAAARDLGAEIEFLTPLEFHTLPLPSYPEIRLALATPGSVRRKVEATGAAHVHIATEGPIGVAARSFCLASGTPFTTSWHTRFPEYIEARTRLPARYGYAALRWFHKASAGVMVAAPSIAAELHGRGFRRLMPWTRGVDHDIFRPRPPDMFDLPRPIFLYAGRLAIEKNIEAFLDLDLPGSKVLAGDGPQGAALRARYPNARFLGMLDSERLAMAYASADVFVFPSRTDTFGNVMIEAMACGLPVAAFPAPGPLDVITGSEAGALDEDLRAACLRALHIPRDKALAHAQTFTWARCAKMFLDNIETARARALRLAQAKKASLSRVGKRPMAARAASRRSRVASKA